MKELENLRVEMQELNDLIVALADLGPLLVGYKTSTTSTT